MAPNPEMNIKMAGFTYAQILPLILAILLIFILPMLMRRYGLEADDLVRILFSGIRKKDYSKVTPENKKKKREPYQTNGRSSDLKSLVSTLLIFTRRNQLGLVYPGTVRAGQETAGLLALLVTKEQVIGFNCFGYGGTITEGKAGGPWNQHMNGADIKIPDALAASRQQHRIVRKVMDENGMADIPLKVVSVFTSHTVTLATKHPNDVFSTESLLVYLKETVAQENEKIDPADISRRLNNFVIRMKPSKSRKQ